MIVRCKLGQNSKQILKKWPKSKISTEIDEEELIETASSCLSKAWKDLLEEQEESSDLLEVDVDDGKMNTALNYMMDSVDLHIIKKGSKLQRIAMKNWKVRNTASEAVK